MSFVETVLEPDPAKSRFPFWVHLLLRIFLQLGVGATMWWSYVEGKTFIFVGVTMVFVYHLVTLFFGEQIRRMVFKVLNRI